MTAIGGIFADASLLLETLKEMDAATLQTALAATAPQHLARAVDQLRCLSYHVDEGSEQAQIIGRFCFEKAPLLQQQGNQPATIDAWVLALRHLPHEAESRVAQRELENSLVGLAQTNKARALDHAALLKATAEPRTPLYGTAVRFLLTCDCDDDNAAMLLQNLAHETGNLDAATIDTVMDRAEALAEKAPYEAAQIFRTFLDHADALTPEQDRRAVAVLKPLTESPRVIAGILQKDYGVSVALPEERAPVYIHPAPPGLH